MNDTIHIENETLVGWVTWKPIGNLSNYEIGISLLPEHRGRGIGTTAQRMIVGYLFNTTVAHRIQAATEEDNLAERRSLESAGFRCEGTNRGVAFFRAGKLRNGVTTLLHATTLRY